MDKTIVRFRGLILCTLFFCAGGLQGFGDEHPSQLAFFQAVRGDNLPVVQALMNRDNGLVNVMDRVTGETALIIAAKNRNNDMMRLLLDVANVNVNVEDNNEMTALFYCIKGNFEQGVELLLQRNAVAVNYQTLEQRETALHMAVESDSTRMVRMLLGKMTINTTLKNTNGKTAFMLAVERQNLRIIQLFRNVSSFDITQTGDDGIPPLLFAIKQFYSLLFIEELLRFRDAIDSKDKDGHDAFAYQERYARNDTRLRELLEAEMARSSSW